MQIHVDLLLIRLVGSWGMSGLQAQRIQYKVYIHLHILLSNKPGVFLFSNLYFPGKVTWALCSFSVIICYILLMFHSVTIPANLNNLRHLLVVTQKAWPSGRGLTASLNGTLTVGFQGGESIILPAGVGIQNMLLSDKWIKRIFSVFPWKRILNKAGNKANTITPHQPG